MIFCTSLARIDEAGVVLGQLMPWIFLCLMAFSVVASWLFSRWFTKPLTKLSHATRQLAEGDYSVRVTCPKPMRSACWPRTSTTWRARYPAPRSCGGICWPT